jgi:hypothetical protein
VSRKLLAAAALTFAANLLHGPGPFTGVVALHAQRRNGDVLREPWNGPEVMELIRRARRARESLAASGDLQSYRADLQGHVYFFVDPDRGERHLIRIDQVAAELAWQAPDRLEQHIVGERTEERLPVRSFDYYPDRLTLVPYGFGDEIRIGTGRDVARVPHPISAPPTPDGSELYDFRLGDSLTLSAAGRDEPVRIREVAVRPRDSSRPAMIGTILLDRDSGSIVRMTFTFTPASYVDPRNDRVEVELDYGLWENRYWLPNLQKIEVRREIPALDLGVGTVIRSVLRVSGYQLNAPLPDDFPSRADITLAPLRERRAYPFSEGLYDAVERDGLAELVVDSDLRELRARAMELIGSAPPSGLGRARLHIPGVSSVVRYDRAEGLRLGVGGSLRPAAGTTLRGTIGYAVAAEEVQADLSLETPLAPHWSLTVRSRLREMGDLGLSPGSAGVISSLSAAFRAEDYRDPFWISGAGIRLEHEVSDRLTIDFGFGIERHASASLVIEHAPFEASRDFRPVREIADAEFFHATLGVFRSVAGPAGGHGWARLDASFLYGDPGDGLGIAGEIEERWVSPSRARRLEMRAIGWNWIGDPLPQGHRLLGGRETVPGYSFRNFVGTRAIAASLTGSADLWKSFLSVRTGLHAGWAGHADPRVADGWAAGSTGGIRTSISLGIGLGWDLLRLDLARGLDGGGWQMWLSVDRGWWDWL